MTEKKRPPYEAVGPEAEELKELVAEALDEHLNPEIEIVDNRVDDQRWLDDGGAGFTPEEEEFFRIPPGQIEAGK